MTDFEFELWSTRTCDACHEILIIPPRASDRCLAHPFELMDGPFHYKPCDDTQVFIRDKVYRVVSSNNFVIGILVTEAELLRFQAILFNRLPFDAFLASVKHEFYTNL